MKRKTHLDSIKQRMEAVDLLRLMKAKYKYDELSSKTKLPVVVLNRYIRGHVLPSAKRARWLIKSLGSEFNVKNELRNRIEFDEEGYLDNTRILGDVLFVKKIANMAKGMFSEITVDKVITAAVDGISIAVPIAQEFKSDLVIAKKEREVGVGDLIEETYVPSFSGVVMSLYIPSQAIHKKENILIVDDIIRSGETQRALIRLVKKKKARVVGIFALIAMGKNGINLIKDEIACHIKILLELPEPKEAR